jgi:hypothetical protein
MGEANGFAFGDEHVKTRDPRDRQEFRAHFQDCSSVDELE